MSERSEKKRESIRKSIKKLAAVCRVPVNQEALEHFERAAMQFEEDVVLKALVYFMDDATFPSVNDLRKRLGFISDKCAPPRPRDDNSYLKIVQFIF